MTIPGPRADGYRTPYGRLAGACQADEGPCMHGARRAEHQPAPACSHQQKADVAVDGIDHADQHEADEAAGQRGDAGDAGAQANARRRPAGYGRRRRTACRRGVQDHAEDGQRHQVAQSRRDLVASASMGMDTPPRVSMRDMAAPISIRMPSSTPPRTPPQRVAARAGLAAHDDQERHAGDDVVGHVQEGGHQPLAGAARLLLRGDQQHVVAGVRGADDIGGDHDGQEHQQRRDGADEGDDLAHVQARSARWRWWPERCPRLRAGQPCCNRAGQHHDRDGEQEEGDEQVEHHAQVPAQQGLDDFLVRLRPQALAQVEDHGQENEGQARDHAADRAMDAKLVKNCRISWPEAKPRRRSRRRSAGYLADFLERAACLRFVLVYVLIGMY